MAAVAPSDDAKTQDHEEGHEIDPTPGSRFLRLAIWMAASSSQESGAVAGLLLKLILHGTNVSKVQKVPCKIT